MILKVSGLLDVSLASWALKPTSLTQREEAMKRLSSWHWPYELQSTRGQGPQPYPREVGGFSSSAGAHGYGDASAPPHGSQGLFLSPDTPWKLGWGFYANTGSGHLSGAGTVTYRLSISWNNLSPVRTEAGRVASLISWYLSNTDNLPVPVLSTLCDLCIFFLIFTTLWSNIFTLLLQRQWAQRNDITCPRSHSKWVAEMGFDSR